MSKTMTNQLVCAHESPALNLVFGGAFVLFLGLVKCAKTEIRVYQGAAVFVRTKFIGG